MKQIVLIFALFLALPQAWAQQVEPDARLLERFSEKGVDRLQASHLVEFWNYYLDNAYFVLDTHGKAASFTNVETVAALSHLKEVPAISAATFDDTNILLYAFKRGDDQRSYYRIGDTGRVMVFYSKNEFIDLFNQATGRK